jgi:hypothetical protein
MKWMLTALLAFCGTAFADYPVVPDPGMTTGVLCSRSDRDFDGLRYGEKIAYCHRNVDGRLKSRIYQEYGIPNKCRHRYTVDHFYPLSMGGNNSAKNLWPEHVLVKKLRFDLEQDTFDQLREGRITQKQALDIIREAKLHPPIAELNQWVELMGGSDCDRAAVQAYLNLR